MTSRSPESIPTAPLSRGLFKGQEPRVLPAIVVHPLLTATDVARLLNVGERSVWRMASEAKAGQGSFPRPVRIGRMAVRWRYQDVQQYLQELPGK